jgi:mRNA interferase MazF
VVKNPGSSELSYVPQRGDIVWIDLDPSQGSEIRKTRPALVVSPASYNEKVGLALLCPITSYKKGYPFEVELSQKGSIQGVVLSDQVKSLDWRARNAKFEEKASTWALTKVIEKLSVLIDLS